MNTQYNAGLYVRLSVEDSVNSQKRGSANPFSHESASIENQRAILYEYAQLCKWNIVQEYIDDGFSGGNYNRPAFHQMMEDAKAGLINLIIVKDLSRLGRDYIETGRYTDEVFPSLGLRFIALMDNIDSEGDIDFLPFRSLLNDYHLKDLSRKIKSVLRAKAEGGRYVINSYPYGFEKSPEDSTRLVIDDYAAAIVHKIFTFRGEGMSHNKIAAALNSEEILSPRCYYYHRRGKQNPYKGSKAWLTSTVRVILQNETYLGHSVLLKSGTVSYKNNQRINKPREAWVVRKNTHPAIISQELWDAAKANNKSYPSSLIRSKNKQPLFYGKLRCAACTSVLGYSTKRQTLASGQTTNYTSYICCLYTQSGKSKCSPHSISELTLLEIIRQDIRQHLERSNFDTNGAVNKIQEYLTNFYIEDLKHEHVSLSARLRELEVVFAKLYEDRLNGTITPDAFKILSAACEEERVAKLDEGGRLTEEINKCKRTIVHIQKWRDSIQSFLALKNPSKEIINELIERIEIGENERKPKQKQRSIKISYRFDGLME